MQQLSAQDAQFIYMQSGNNLTHVTGVNIYDPSTAKGGNVRFKDIVGHIASRLDTSPLFRRRLYQLPFHFDHPYWVEDEHFDVEAHITHARLPEPGDWRQLCIQIARRHSQPIDMNRPLWDMLVIEGLDQIPHFAKGSYALITRIHHAAIDGASAMHFFSGLSDKDAKGTPAIPLLDARGEIGEVPSARDILGRAILANVSSPFKLIKALQGFAPALVDMVKPDRAGDEPDKPKASLPQTRFNGAVSPHKVFEAVTWPLADFKVIRKKVAGATVNDVVLAVTAGGLREYLESHGELPDEPLVAVAPINARSKAGDEAMPGNNISAMTVKIWTNIADPLERLAAIRSATKEAKEAKSGLGARMMTDLSQHIPSFNLAALGRLLSMEKFALKFTNLFVSNVPGANQQLFMNGARLTHQYGLTPISNGMGLFVVAMSYDGNLSFNLISDRDIMPDIGYFRECLERAFRALRDAD